MLKLENHGSVIHETAVYAFCCEDQKPTRQHRAFRWGAEEQEVMLGQNTEAAFRLNNYRNIAALAVGRLSDHNP